MLKNLKCDVSTIVMDLKTEAFKRQPSCMRACVCERERERERTGEREREKESERDRVKCQANPRA